MKHLLLRNAFTLKALLLVGLLVSAVSGAWAEDVTDILNRDLTGVTGSSYTSWSGKKGSSSSAVYAGQSAGGNSSIQLRSNNNNSGIISTTSGGIVKSVTVKWNSSTVAGRTLVVYGKHTAYSSPEDLYGNTNKGYPLGEIVCGTSTTLNVAEELKIYEYIGLCSKSGAMYLEEIQIVWENGSTTKIDPELSFSTDVVNATFGVDPELPTLNTATDFDGTVEYSSSDETVAQILDSETGDLRILKGGTTTITATFAGNDNFNSGSASYTLNVTDNRIATSISCDPIELDINDVGTLTMLRPVVLDAKGNVVEYTNDPKGDGLPEVYFEIVSDDNGIFGSFDSHGNIVLNSVEGTTTIKAVYNYFQLNENYQPSECTFTITITAPFTGGDVTFDASKDKGNTSQGTGTITKNGVTFACSNGVLGNGTEYRLYKDSQTTFTTTEGKITKIVFTQPSSSHAISNLTPDTGSLDDLTWTGRASSVVFTAAAQARTSQIVVTVDMRADAGLAFDESANVNATLGEAFTAPTLINPNKLSVVYVSGNEEVATVDPATGAVTLVGAGDATITATFEGDDTYSEGSASYTIKVTAANEVATPEIVLGATTFFESTTATITCATEGATIFYSTDNGENWQTYSEAITLTETTTIIAKATKKGATDSQICEAATATKNSVEADLATLAAKEAGTYYVNLNNVVVTYVNGNNAYLQDASGAILLYKNGHGFTAGQVINGVASVTLQIRSNNPQLTALTGAEGYSVVDGTAPEPTTVAVDEWDTPINTVLGQYLKVTGATITSESSKYYVQLGEEKVQLYGQGDARTISVEDLEATYTIVGFPTVFNTTPELVIYVQPEKEEAVDERAEVTLSFIPEELNAILGETFTAPTLTIKDAKGEDVTGLTITYSVVASGDSPIEINPETGEVTLKAEGEANVVATFEGNTEYKQATASYKLHVLSNKAASNLTIGTLSSNTLSIGDIIKLTYTTSSDGDITWSTSNANVLTVDQQGNVEAVAVGEATITVAQSETESYKAGEASIKLTVVDPNQGQYLWLLSEASYSSASTDAVTWTSDYATMVIEKDNAGTNANNYLGGENSSTRFYKNSTLTVAPVEGYRIASVLFQATTENYATIFKNSTWTNVAEPTLDRKSVILTPTDGMEPIVATIGGTCGFDKVQVTYVKTDEVVKQSANLAFAETTFNVEPEADFTAPKLTTAEGFDGTVVYSSSDADIALVDETTGEVLIGDKEGVVTITATSAETDNFKAGSASYTITVKAPEKAEPEISFAEAIYTVNIGEEFTAPALINPHGLTVTYSCDNVDIALVDETTGDVVLDTQAKATVTITATFAGDETYKAGSASYTIKIVDPTEDEFDLTIASYETATEDEVVWDGGMASMVLAKSSSKTRANNYLGGDNDHTRVYKEQLLTITSEAKEIVSIQLLSNNSSAHQLLIDNANYCATSESNSDLTYVAPEGFRATSVTFNILSAARLTKVVVTYADHTVPGTYVREELTAGNWGTICLPYDARVDGATLYTLAGIDDKDTPSKMYLSEAENLEAGKPYFFQATANTLTATYISGVASKAQSVNGLVGTLEAIIPDAEADPLEGMYLLSGGKIIKCGTGCSLAANRAYIDMKQVSVYDGETAGVKVFNLGGEDGISSLDAASEGAVIYDLSGRRVSKTTKGLYIVNGKKVSVR